MKRLLCLGGTMKKVLVTVAALGLLLLNHGLAEEILGINGWVYSEGCVKGVMDTSYGYQLQVDMPIPVDCTDQIRQYKMASRSMTQKDIQNLLSGKVLTNVPDAKWVYRQSDQEGTLFQFQEDNLKYSWVFSRQRYSPIDAECASDELLRAEATVRQILDSMRVPYEYPFYTVSKGYQTLNTKLYPANIESLDDVKNRLLAGQKLMPDGKLTEGQYCYDLINSYQGFDDEYIYVFVRLQKEGIPFACGGIVSPSYQEDNPVYDEGVYLEFQLTSDGQITFARASNIQDIVQEAEENRAVLSWSECLTALCSNASDQTLGGIESAMLVRAELCYAINQRHVTYPVWQFVIEIHYEGAEFPYAAYPCTFYVDAITGQCL